MDQLRARYADLGRAFRHAMTDTRWFDGAVGLGIGMVALAQATRVETIVASVLLGGALTLRRRAPLAVYLVAFGLISGYANEIPFGAFIGVLVAGYTLAAYGRWPLVSFLVMFGSALFVTVVFHSSLSFLPQASTGFLVIGTLWLAGNAIRVRQRRADDLADRARQREHEQEQERQIALSEQRARIARELHDVVTHNVTVMLVQAGAARTVMKGSPEQAAEALLAVEARGREALTELRGFLGVLDTSAEEEPELLPQPGTADITTLVRGVADAGLPVTLEVVGESRELPDGVGLTAYRVVQEALTNAIKYAAGSPTEVVLEYRVDELAVEVLDSGPGKTAATVGVGRGLAGLRERLAVYGGRLEAGRRPSGGFAVRAWIPTAAASL